jgi:CBS domain-containing protein
MATVNDLLAIKGNRVVSVGSDATVLNAAIVMNEHRIGAVVIKDGERVAGMFTERDVLQRVVGERRDPSQTRVTDVMTSEILCCKRETSLDELRTVMKEKRIRHLPVVDGDQRLEGLVSIGDLNAYLAASQEQTIHHLHEYLYGRA